jgi:mono/diheme cytochrome c family protein
MSPTVSLAFANLSTGHAVILLVVAGVFILFALVSSFVIPRRNPNFPGNSVGVYSAVAILFLIAMIATVIAFGKEKKHAESSSTAGTTTTQTSTPSSTSSTSTSPTTTGAGTTGDPVAGKKVFTSAGCSGCHTLKDAGATGNIGPNLDDLKPSEAAVQHQVEVGGGAMPAFKGQLSATQIQNVAAYVSSAAGS